MISTLRTACQTWLTRAAHIILLATQTITMQHLDPHERPPDGIRNVYKKYQKMTPKELDCDADIVDLTDYSVALPSKVRLIEHVGAKDLEAAFRIFAGSDAEGELRNLDAVRAVPIYEYEDLPGRSLHLMSQFHMRHVKLPTPPSHPTTCLAIHDKHHTSHSPALIYPPKMSP
jgi:hypothetical protein